MSVPNWLLKILMGFLKNRKLVVKYNGAYSEMKDMPGGGPAGTILGMVLFIILVNPVKFSENFTWGHKITQKMSKRTPITSLHLKYFDDLSLLEAINLKEALKNDQRPKQYPIMYHQITGHRQDDKKLRTVSKVKEIQQFTESNKMVLNSDKSRAMLFNKEVVEEPKILGLIISSDLKWNSHAKYICKRGFMHLWMLRRLKKLGASQKILIDIYN